MQELSTSNDRLLKAQVSCRPFIDLPLTDSHMIRLEKVLGCKTDCTWPTRVAELEL